jgi:hypothetical protein
MKTKRITWALAAAAIFLAGCWQKSVYPFYRDKDVFYEASLVGSWQEPGKAAEDVTTWTFEKGELPNVYNLHVADKETKINCNARLFKLGAERFMDLHSRNRSVNEIPAHHLFRVRELGESFRFQLLNLDWFNHRLQLYPKEIANVRSPDPEHPEDADQGEFILTADTEHLQKYILEHLNDEGFFDNETTLKKVK